MEMDNKKKWLVTGVSGGLGRAIALAAAQEGHIVYGTLRNKEQFNAYEDLVPGNTIPLLLDVTNKAAISIAIADIIGLNGSIDVVVNNAGYGLIGGIEEVSEKEIRNQMETNFFGAMWVTQSVLPIMRKQKSGWILQVSSSAGFRSAAGFGIYNASKFALEGMSEALAQEMKPLGVHVVILEPGPFRTNFAGSSAVFSEQNIPAYDATVGQFKRIMTEKSGTQDGDPNKAAAVILALVKSNNPPVRLPLGHFSITAIRNKLVEVEKDIQAWEHLTSTTSFEEQSI